MDRHAFWKRAIRLRLLPTFLSAMAVGLASLAGASAQTSPHGPLRFECRTCHTPESWTMRSDASFKHEETGFPLIEQHSGVRCASCHEGLKFKKTGSNCLSCHTDIHKSEMGANCLRCHTQQSWYIPDMIQRHQSTRFPLLGRHGTVSCQECHTNAGRKQYAGTPTNCYGCHAETFAGTTSPGHVAAGFSTDCSQCHQVTAMQWGGGFSHQLSGFPLSGAHGAATCAECHQNNNFHLQYTGCYTCHKGDYAKTTSPSHAAAGFPTDCLQCHQSSATTWGNGFSHQGSRFPLTGTHTTLPCAQCHTNNNYQLQYTDCYKCHTTEYTQPTNPNHAQGNFSHTCEPCHTTNAWKPATFNHSSTAFQLTGAHSSVACSQCHQNGNYQLHFTDCYACHTTDFAQPANPSHVQGNFSRTCTQCHSTTAWKPATFSHTATAFQLTGAHATVACVQCHVNGNYQLKYTDCYACHATDFAQPTSPNHVQGNFSHTCTQCHSATVWKPATFNHSATTFQLTGAHSTLACAQCHVNGNYQLQYTDCYACHIAVFAQPVNPNHVQANFSHTCTQCHSTSAWKPSTFSHSATKFALTGAHTSLLCSQCHTNGNYQLQYTDCYGCHASAFTQSVNPNHVQGNFSHTCTDCHSTTAWTPATFSHASTAFPLTGAHQTLACSQCHVNGNYQLKFTDCYSCHATSFTQSVNPNHVQGNFSHMCTQCHSSTAWKPATFSHSATAFQLTGAHTTLTCAQCHINGNYQLQYTDCYACHGTDFAKPTNPNHVLGNFKHTCNSCHTTTVWTPSTFSHSTTAFPLVGAHQAVACNQCHANNVYTGLPHGSCWDCHSGTFNGAANPNHVTGGFGHDCTTCHSQTAWQPATFNHSNTKFSLTGAHIPLACTQCHANGNYTLTYQNCYQCHSSNYSAVANPNHVNQVFPKDCTGCHSTSVWTPNTMNHDAAYFRIYSGKHSGRWNQCSQCHTSPGNLGAYNCTTACHQSAHNKGQDCYSCHRNV